MTLTKKYAWQAMPFLFFLVLVSFQSCTDDNLNSSDFEAGEAFTNSNIRVYEIDTVTVSTSTMKFDSLATSSATRMLIGQYNDPVFGTVKASSYAQVLPTSYTIDSDSEYDSIVLYLKPDSYYYNDTLLTNNIKIRRITEDLKPDNGETYFYNTSTIAYDSTNLGDISFTPRPITADSLEIKLSDSLGTEIFENLQDKLIVNDDEFKNFLKGIAFIPDDNDDGSIIGYSYDTASTYIRLYHSIPESDERVQSYTDLQINMLDSPTPFFVSITSKDPIEPLQTLTDKEIDLKSEDSYDLSFIQSGVGIAMKISFPHIKRLYDINGSGTVLDAVLKIKPAEQSYDDNLMLNSTLSVFKVDQNNSLTEQLTIDGATAVTATLNTDNQEFNEIYYEIPLSTYIEEILTESPETNESLILFPYDYISEVNRFILQGNSQDSFETVLEITYAIYDED